MPVFHTDGVETNTRSTSSALQRLPRALTKLWHQHEALENIEGFEREVHALFAEAEREDRVIYEFIHILYELPTGARIRLKSK